MVLLGILAITAVPRFTGSQDFEAYSIQDQILSAARMAQQRAMYDRDTNACYYADVTNNVLSVKFENGGPAVNIGPTQEWRDGISIDSSITIANQKVYFDGLGNAIDACGGNQNVADVSFAITAPFALAVCINPAGYINEC